MFSLPYISYYMHTLTHIHTEKNDPVLYQFNIRQENEEKEEEEEDDIILV